MRIGDLLHWHDNPELLAICVAIIRNRSVVIVKWVSPERNSNPNGTHAYIHNFKKVRTG